MFTNVSNFEWTNDELYYGQQILAALGDSSLHLVIDTSRNGIGPGNTWCEPSGRALGLPPTASTGYSFVDAFLWVKPPGEADGCADKAGTFDPSLAAALASDPAGGTPSCEVTYAIASAWTGGFTANVTVHLEQQQRSADVVHDDCQQRPDGHLHNGLSEAPDAPVSGSEPLTASSAARASRPASHRDGHPRVPSAGDGGAGSARQR